MKTTTFTEPVMRPPQEASSLLVRATQGCTYNGCNFCYVSRGYPFRAVTPEQFEEEVLARKPAFSPDANVYLTGSNPFALPAEKLHAYIAVLRKHLPGFSELSMQAMVRDIADKSQEELQELRSSGLTHLYVGVENGNDEALRLMNKGHTAKEAVAQLHRLDRAGIGYVTYYVLGLGGRGQAETGARATAALFNQVTPRRITTTGLTVFPPTPLARMASCGEFIEASEREKMEELLCFLENLTTDTFFDAVHYLNPLNYRFKTGSGEMADAVADIRDILATHSDEDLELMVGRHMMASL